MRTEEEIRNEIIEQKELLDNIVFDSAQWAAKNSRIWALKWVLEDKEA